MRARARASALAALLLVACTTAPAAAPDVPWAAARGAKFYALRLRPGQDLLRELERFARERKLHAAFVASCAGSLSRASVRYANQPTTSVRDGHFEIVSLSGTLSGDSRHVHVGLADSTGAAFGGHLASGSLVYTTAEIVIGELSGVTFAREVDSTYGYKELVPKAR